MRLVIGRACIVCVSLLVAGCSESCGKDKPYVPYSIDPSAGASPGGSEVQVPGEEPPVPDKAVQRFKAVGAQRLKDLPKETASSLGALQAPRGMRFELLLDADLDGDSKKEVVAWLRSEDGTRGELVQFGSAREGGPLRATTLAPLPADMTTSTGCEATADLQQVGPRSLAVSYERKCRTGKDPATQRWLAAVVPTRNPAERLSVLIDDGAGASELRVQMDGLDRDGDGFDDLLIEIAIEEPGLPDGSVSASLHYFDRPAGLSRDPHEPSASLAAVAKRVGREAKRKEALPKVQSMGRRLRRLYAMLCAEGGTAKVRVAGSTLQCGARDSVLAAAEQEMDAALRADAWAWAFGVQQRIAALGGNDDIVARTQGRLETAAQRVDATAYHLPFTPVVPAAEATWGGLAFDDAGALRIRTSTTPMRFDPRSRVAIPDAPGAPAQSWDGSVVGPGGTRQLLRLDNGCDGGLVRAGFGAAGAAAPDAWVPLPVDAVACTAPAQGTRVVSWDEQGLLLIASGLPVRVGPDLKTAAPGGAPQGRVQEGSGRSPDGKRWVTSTPLGVLVIGDGLQPQLWRSANMSAHDALHSCAVSNGATAIACVDGKRTRVMVP